MHACMTGGRASADNSHLGMPRMTWLLCLAWPAAQYAVTNVLGLIFRLYCNNRSLTTVFTTASATARQVRVRVRVWCGATERALRG